MASITPVIRRDKANADGTAPICLRVADRDRSLFVSLGIRVKPAHWLDGPKQVSKRSEHADDFNEIIRRKQEAAEAALYRGKVEGKELSAKELAAYLRGPREDGDFHAYAEEIRDEFKRRGQAYTYVRYKSVLKKFKDFTGSPLPFKDIDVALLRRFETHLVEVHANTVNTVASNFRAIKAVLYRAIREGKADQGANPFFHFKIRQKPGERVKLSPEQIRAIAGLDLDPGSSKWHTRNYFLFSFYCAGVRFRDLCLLRRSNVVEEDGVRRLVYTMSKTGRRKSIRLYPAAEAILREYATGEEGDPYVFPLLNDRKLGDPLRIRKAIGSRNAVVNSDLKDIAAMAGIPVSLSFHVSRHSFADYARQQDWDVYSISKALGHSNIKVTESYLKGFDQDALDEKMGELLGKLDGN